MASHEITKYRLARSPRWPMRTDHVANLTHREPTTLRKQRAPQCDRLSGGSLLSNGFGGFNARCYAMAFAFLGIYPSTEVWLRYASPQVASLINGVDDHKAVNERRRSRSVFPRSGTSLAGGERPIDQKPLRCDGLTRNHKISSRKEPPVAYANRPHCKFGPSRTDHVAKSTRREPTTPARPKRLKPPPPIHLNDHPRRRHRPEQLNNRSVARLFTPAGREVLLNRVARQPGLLLDQAAQPLDALDGVFGPFERVDDDDRIGVFGLRHERLDLGLNCVGLRPQMAIDLYREFRLACRITQKCAHEYITGENLCG